MVMYELIQIYEKKKEKEKKVARDSVWIYPIENVNGDEFYGQLLPNLINGNYGSTINQFRQQ